MNVDRILEELRLEQTVLTRRAQDLTAAIETLERLRNGSPVDGKVTVARRPRPGSSAVDWVRCRQQYENGGVAVAQLAKVFKVTIGPIYKRIKDEGWTRKAAT